ncbi:serine/threonine protein kinase [Knoellia sinensis KCTC 19936]|uniref:non-specific serine/threonine protein kinase n=1 Tax=Knoellia sinensis KCTC 19936 TaxID=1385520 RepID=A0A0A0J3A6_9MICO|nr:serine/threonine-protein kinase [Knoellia sinensis]KGN31174.1 serine/threonine protein kinase [Knoellia sinensis KCTC 19936]
MSRTAPSTAPEIPGLVYRQPLGSGGYADVFLYEQQMPRMPVAVKVLKRDGLTPAIRRQFIEEANTMAELADHPYIVQVFRSEQLADGGAYLVMKYYPPPNLATRAKRERLTVEEVLRTGIQLSSAVETAHRAGIIHRDIKPANVLVSQYGAPGLTDFGIAGRGGNQDEHDEDVGVSVPWSPPEVLYGQSNGDSRSDVYSLAATLWHLLVGRSPFEQPGGDNSAYALMPRIRATPAPQTGRADVPLSLERLLGQAMAKKPDARPQTAIEFARGLQAIEQEQRFARTPIVVLDESGHTTVADGGGRPAPEHTDHDRTSVRAPAVMSPQPQLPTATPRSADEAAVDEGPQPLTISGGALLAGVGVVLLALVGALVWAIGFRSDDAPVDASTDAPRASATVGGGGPVVDIPEPPGLDGQGVPGSVVFTWNYAGVRKGDFYRMRIAPSQAEVVDAEVTTVREMPHKVAAAPGETVCAQVAVARAAGATSAYSGIKCLQGG